MCPTSVPCGGTWTWLSQMEEETAFWVALRLLNYHNLQCLYSHAHPFLSDFLKHFHCYCERVVPALCQSFAEKGFLTTLYAVEVRSAPHRHTHLNLVSFLGSHSGPALPLRALSVLCSPLPPPCLLRVCTQWFTTAFSLSLPIDTACCVLDLVLGGWDNVLFRVGTAILVLLENELLLWGLEDLMLVRALALSVDMLLPFLRVPCAP